MRTTLVNLHNYKENDVVYIDRRSVFGNLFHIGPEHSNREEVIAAYKEWFYTRIEIDPDFEKAVQRLKGRKLACWCAPLPCHGDIIINYLEEQE